MEPLLWVLRSTTLEGWVSSDYNCHDRTNCTCISVGTTGISEFRTVAIVRFVCMQMLRGSEVEE
jgi:hypothetical protein